MSAPGSMPRERRSWRGWCRSTGGGTCTTGRPTRGSLWPCGIRRPRPVGVKGVRMAAWSLRWRFLITALALVPTRSLPQVPDSAGTARTLLAFEDARFAAMVRADTAWLRDALAEDLSYVHSSARSETKAQYLESVGSGSL